MRRIRDNVFVGPAAQPGDLPRLRVAGVTAILSLQEPGGDLPIVAVERMRAACGDAICFLNVPVRDYDPHDLIRRLPVVLDGLAELLGAGHVVYVHCCEGVNRAPSVALAYLVQVERRPIDEALAEFVRLDPVGRPYAEFVAWLRRQA